MRISVIRPVDSVQCGAERWGTVQSRLDSCTRSLTFDHGDSILKQVSKNYARRGSCPLHEISSSAKRRRGASTLLYTVIFSRLARSRNGELRLVNSRRFWVSASPTRRACTAHGGPTRRRVADTATLLPGRQRDGGRERWTSKRRGSCSRARSGLLHPADHRRNGGGSPSRRFCPHTIRAPGRKASRQAASRCMTTWDA